MKKLTKYMVCLAAVLVVAASTMGCVDFNVDKATGGGWFYDIATENKCTFGFNAQLKDNPEAVENEKIYTGQFQFKDHETGVKFHLEEMTGFIGWNEKNAIFGGYDKDGNYVGVQVLDAGEPGWSEGDAIAIWYDYDDFETSSDEVEPTWSGYIAGGNIQTHP